MKSCKLIIKDEVNIKLEGLPIEARRKLANTFKYVDPTARFRPSYKSGRWDGSTSLFGIGGSGYLHHIERILQVLNDLNIDVTDIDDRRIGSKIEFKPITESYWADQNKVWPEGHIDAGKPIILRDYQVNAINIFLNNHQSLQEIATGAGKTITIATLSRLCESYGRTVVIVPNKSLVEQTLEDYITVGLDVGVYYGDQKDLNCTHTICTWQSLNILDKKSKETVGEQYTLAEFLDGVKAVIVDEVHMAKAEVLKNLLTRNLNNACIRWGLTGTIPKHIHETEQIFASIGPVVGGIQASELQKRGVLSNCHVNIIQLIDLPEFKNYAEELKYLVTNEQRMIYISNLVKTISEKGNTLILVNRIDTGKFLVNEIEGSVFISGNVKTKERREEYDEVAISQNKVIIATYGVAAVGINIPRIFNLVLIEPGKSFVRVIQSIVTGKPDRKSTRLNSSHLKLSRMPSSA